ncbi:hypothetical protein HUG15_10240 [Salicibibacter cibarius]|uniref:Uncharacterized protein n=1 Tax=Salicibibacter cibarius TaxID=2743000 RepID=A0A7T7CBK0_9BACI|nr:hypothetical protein [Salicibibacter cibarius]QQK75904.1 hypothetical protein HUG15_10240 [Salicibibacter cibarius]
MDVSKVALRLSVFHRWGLLLSMCPLLHDIRGMDLKVDDGRSELGVTLKQPVI